MVEAPLDEDILNEEDKFWCHANDDDYNINEMKRFRKNFPHENDGNLVVWFKVNCMCLYESVDVYYFLNESKSSNQLFVKHQVRDDWSSSSSSDYKSSF